MRGFAESIVAVLFVILEYAVAPALFLWGWARWFNRPKPRTLFLILSFVGFALATGSAVLALLSFVDARSVVGFALHDSQLLIIFWSAGVLSITATAFALAGVWRPSPLRWHALVCAVATLLFCLATAVSP
jgi:hypothetical protein